MLTFLIGVRMGWDEMKWGEVCGLYSKVFVESCASISLAPILLNIFVLVNLHVGRLS